MISWGERPGAALRKLGLGGADRGRHRSGMSETAAVARQRHADITGASCTDRARGSRRVPRCRAVAEHLMLGVLAGQQQLAVTSLTVRKELLT
jgi:hypothetical protein